MTKSSLSKTEIQALKKELLEYYLVNLNYYGNCCGQLFSIDHTSSEIKKYIIDFFEKHGLEVSFSEDGSGFYTVRSD